MEPLAAIFTEVNLTKRNVSYNKTMRFAGGGGGAETETFWPIGLG